MEAQRLEEVAAAEFEKLKKADEKSDTLELASAVLAVALFFAGVATLFRLNAIKFVLCRSRRWLSVSGAATMVTSP